MPNESLHPMAHGYPRGYRTYWPYLRWYAALKQEQGRRVKSTLWPMAPLNVANTVGLVLEVQNTLNMYMEDVLKLI